MRPDGTIALSFGMRDGGTYAYTPDGRFSCKGRGCEQLGCSVGLHVEPSSSAACAAARSDLDIDEELKRASSIPADFRAWLL